VHQQLGDEPERQELDADDHEQDRDDQRRALTDPAVEDLLLHEQPREHQHADERDADADTAEQVERPVRVAREEADGHQVEAAAPEARRPEFRLAVQARPVLDVDLADLEPVPVREHRDVAVQLAVEVQRVGDFARERSESVAIGDVDVLEVELDPVEAVVATERGDVADRALPRIRRGEDVVNDRLVEARVHDQGDDLHALRAGRRQHARVDAAPDRADAVHRERLRRDDGDLVRVGEKALDARLGVGRVPERLALGGGGARGE